MFILYNLILIITLNFVNSYVFSYVFLGIFLYCFNLNFNAVNYFVSFITNNLVTYNVSANLNNLYNGGFMLAIFMVLQIVSGILLTMHYSFAFYAIVYIVKDLSTGWFFRYMHSMNCSMIHFLVLIHVLRGLQYLSYLYTPNVYLSGIVLYILIVVISFLGYVLPYGQMSYWGATVITNIVALIPNLMEVLLGNYVMGTVTLRRFFVFHFILSLVLIVVMLIHIIFLHKFGSTNPLFFNNVKINFYPYFYAKDLYMFFFVLLTLFLNYFNFVELSHSDNNVEVNPLVTPLHIVPEWYFLSFYTVLKAINSKIAGILLMVAFFVLLFNVVSFNYTTILVWNSNNTNIVMDWFALYAIFMFIGAKLPLAIYLYLAKLFIVIIYARMFNSHMNYSNSNITMASYFTINAYSYYFTVWNIVLWVQLATMHVNIEMNESLINNWVFLFFIIVSEVLLFLSFFGLLFNVYSYYIFVNHYHLYYTGLLILCHASLMSNTYVLYMLSSMFVSLQVLEYRNMTYTLNYNNYTSLFYFITTLHLLHILIGLYMLMFVYYNRTLLYSKSNMSYSLIALNAHRVMEYEVLVNLYWNFVEFLWLLIFFLYSYFNVREYGSLNHKVIGMNYLIASVYFGLVAILFSMLIRIELLSSGNRIIFEQNNFVYNYLISLHGLGMIFFLVMPVVFAAVGNTLVPIHINAAELKLSKLNNLSFIFFIFSFVLIINGALLEFGIGVGWTLYPPLSTYSINLSKLSLELVVLGLVFNGLASLLSSINFFVSTFYMMNIYVVSLIPLYTMAVLLSAYMLIVSLPVLTCGLISILLDIMLNTVLLDPAFGGDPVFYQHLFWIFGHPEVYIMILPSFGLVNNYLTILTSKVVFGLSTMNLALVGITFLGFVVWAHHMYVVGLESDTRAYFTATTIMISIPTGTKIFNWLCSFYCNLVLFMDMNMFIFFFVFIFTVGGASGVMLGNAGVDIMLHDTYYVVAHFHQVLAIASVLSILLFVIATKDTLHFLKLFNNINASNIGFLFTSLFVHVNLLFMNMLFVGFSVMPRRIPEYSDESTLWNLLASINSLSVFILLLFTML